MLNQLLITCKNSGAIAVLLLINTLGVSATEYVFTAPPEVDRQIVEIPARDTDYPLYECNAETAAKPNETVDSHNCTCKDCQEKEKVEESAPKPSASTAKSKPKP